MTFLALVLALVLSLVWPYQAVLHRDQWFLSLQQQLASMGVSGSLLLALQVGLPVLVVSLVLAQAEQLLFGLPWIVLASLLLLYSLGRTNNGQCAERYRSQCRRGDFEAALLTAQQHYPELLPNEQVPADPHEVHVAVQRALLHAQLRGWFGVLLYFVLLGPAAAVAYRLLLLGDKSAAESPLVAVVDWLPARLAAVSFTLTGNFVESVDECFDGFRRPGMATRDLLFSVARAATGQDKREPPADAFGDYAARENEELSALQHRSAVCWVLVISLWAIAG